MATPMLRERVPPRREEEPPRVAPAAEELRSRESDGLSLRDITPELAVDKSGGRGRKEIPKEEGKREAVRPFYEAQKELRERRAAYDPYAERKRHDRWVKAFDGASVPTEGQERLFSEQTLTDRESLEFKLRARHAPLTYVEPRRVSLVDGLEPPQPAARSGGETEPEPVRLDFSQLRALDGKKSGEASVFSSDGTIYRVTLKTTGKGKKAKREYTVQLVDAQAYDQMLERKGQALPLIYAVKEVVRVGDESGPASVGRTGDALRSAGLSEEAIARREAEELERTAGERQATLIEAAHQRLKDMGVPESSLAPLALLGSDRERVLVENGGKTCYWVEWNSADRDELAITIQTRRPRPGKCPEPPELGEAQNRLGQEIGRMYAQGLDAECGLPFGVPANQVVAALNSGHYDAIMEFEAARTGYLRITQAGRGAADIRKARKRLSTAIDALFSGGAAKYMPTLQGTDAATLKAALSGDTKEASWQAIADAGDPALKALAPEAYQEQERIRGLFSIMDVNNCILFAQALLNIRKGLTDLGGGIGLQPTYHDTPEEIKRKQAKQLAWMDAKQKANAWLDKWLDGKASPWSDYRNYWFLLLYEEKETGGKLRFDVPVSADYQVNSTVADLFERELSQVPGMTLVRQQKAGSGGFADIINPSPTASGTTRFGLLIQHNTEENVPPLYTNPLYIHPSTPDYAQRYAPQWARPKLEEKDLGQILREANQKYAAQQQTALQQQAQQKMNPIDRTYVDQSARPVETDNVVRIIIPPPEIKDPIKILPDDMAILRFFLPVDSIENIVNKVADGQSINALDVGWLLLDIGLTYTEFKVATKAIQAASVGTRALRKGVFREVEERLALELVDDPAKLAAARRYVLRKVFTQPEKLFRLGEREMVETMVGQGTEYASRYATRTVTGVVGGEYAALEGQSAVVELTKDGKALTVATNWQKVKNTAFVGINALMGGHTVMSTYEYMDIVFSDAVPESMYAKHPEWRGLKPEEAKDLALAEVRFDMAKLWGFFGVMGLTVQGVQKAAPAIKDMLGKAFDIASKGEDPAEFLARTVPKILRSAGLREVPAELDEAYVLGYAQLIRETAQGLKSLPGRALFYTPDAAHAIELGFTGFMYQTLLPAMDITIDEGLYNKYSHIQMNNVIQETGLSGSGVRNERGELARDEGQMRQNLERSMEHMVSLIDDQGHATQNYTMSFKEGLVRNVLLVDVADPAVEKRILDRGWEEDYMAVWNLTRDLGLHDVESSYNYPQLTDILKERYDFAGMERLYERYRGRSLDFWMGITATAHTWLDVASASDGRGEASRLGPSAHSAVGEATDGGPLSPAQMEASMRAVRATLSAVPAGESFADEWEEVLRAGSGEERLQAAIGLVFRYRLWGLLPEPSS